MKVKKTNVVSEQPAQEKADHDTVKSSIDSNDMAPFSITMKPSPHPSPVVHHHTATARFRSKDSKKRRESVGRRLRSAAVADDFCKAFGIFFALLVRLLLFAFSLFTVYLLVNQLEDVRYWALTGTNLLLVIETAYTLVTRAGQERKWLCLCFICYLMSTVPSVWLLELDRLNKYNESKAANSSRKVTIAVSQFSTIIEMDTEMALDITEQCLVFLLILCRWLLPRGDITRDILSQLLFVFIGMASDVMELFQLFKEVEVRNNEILIYIILTVWTISIFQFTLVMTMSNNPKKAVKSHEIIVEEASLTDALLHTEAWSLIATIFMQDGPFLAVRLYVLFSYDLASYTIIFFTCKNVLVVMLLLYRCIVICLRRFEGKDNDNTDANNVDIDNGINGRKVRNNSALASLDARNITNVRTRNMKARNLGRDKRNRVHPTVHKLRPSPTRSQVRQAKAWARISKIPIAVYRMRKHAIPATKPTVKNNLKVTKVSKIARKETQFMNKPSHVNQSNYDTTNSKPRQIRFQVPAPKSSNLAPKRQQKRLIQNYPMSFTRASYM